MKNHLVNNAVENRRAPQQLECKIVVEASNIDFLRDEALFVAGSGNDCSAISPLPQPARSKRRTQRVSER
ncbi:hypothetical protein ACEN9J_11340 [Variovorax sp. Varisp41]|uniref:hypothetical protein n=1 Tax=unclassified Variovorax TaxID=663243 RepID=UPI0039B4FFF7